MCFFSLHIPGTIQVFLQDLFLCKIEVTHNPYFLINCRDQKCRMVSVSGKRSAIEQLK